MTIPLVDYEAENHNWNKFLNIINCLTGPLFTVFAIKVGFNKVFNVIPVWALAIVLSFLLAIFIMVKTKWDERPKYHWVLLMNCSPPIFNFINFCY
jgi:sodium/potassium/calcium exchanger 6